MKDDVKWIRLVDERAEGGPLWNSYKPQISIKCFEFLDKLGNQISSQKWLCSEETVSKMITIFKKPTLQKQVKYPDSIHTNDHNTEIQTHCS